MTIKLGSIRITLFKFEKLERYEVKIDHEASRQQANEIKNDPKFAELKAKAAALRAAR